MDVITEKSKPQALIDVRQMKDEEIHLFLQQHDPLFARVLKEVGILSFKTLLRPIYVALIGAVIGQKISYQAAKKIRGQLYTRIGTNFTPKMVDQLIHDHLESPSVFEPFVPKDKLEIMIRINSFLTKSCLNLQTVEDVWKLKAVHGIGDWTIKTTLLTSGLDFSVFPVEDYFLRKRVQRLFSSEYSSCGSGKSIPSVDETSRFVQRWGPYSGLYAWYLWRWF